MLRRLVFLVIALTGCRTAASFDAAAVHRLLEREMREQHIPGLAVAIVRDGRVIYLNALGLRDVERQLPVTPDTLMPIGSCTKAFTSMAVARAADRGLLSLDDHPRRFLPYIRLADPEADAKVTLRDMLSHRTGLKAYADLAAEPGVLTREEYVRAATSAKPVAPFGTKFQYSNAMYAAAGEIVGRVNGTTWEQAIPRDIFQPLGMTSSVADLREAHATGYAYDDKTKTWRAVPPPASLNALAPAGGIASTARDMARWLVMLSQSGRDFISPAMFRELTTPRIEINATLSYALGWATYDLDGLHVVEHNGGSQGLSALVSFIPERRAGFVFLANHSPTPLTRVGSGLAKTLWPLILGIPAAASPAPAPAPAPTPRVTTPPTLPPAADIVAKMIEAAGGERVLRSHTSVEIHARKTYENQGIVADLTRQARAPNLRNELEVWTAANREIGRLRIYFDGTHGGQETTFGQDELNDDPPEPLHWLLDAAPTVVGVDDDSWILELAPDSTIHASTRTGLITRRDKNGEITTFDDYRDVDGEFVPFRMTITDPLGESTIEVQSVRFNTEIPEGAFRAARTGGR